MSGDGRGWVVMGGNGSKWVEMGRDGSRWVTMGGDGQCEPNKALNTDNGLKKSQ